MTIRLTLQPKQIFPTVQPRSFAINPATSQFLDLSRWFASFLVVFSHVRSIVLANYVDVATNPTLATKFIYFLATFGHQSVVVFFVISGFLVGGRAFLKANDGQFSFLDYAIHRFARIYIVLVPALLLGLVFDLIGSQLVDGYGLYTNNSPFHWWMIDFSISDRLGPETLLGNLLLLQTILVNSLGSNGPLWSLANEWWYYVAFALGMGTLIIPNRGPRLVCSCALAVLAFLLPIEITLGSSLWLLGVGAAVLEQRWRGWPALVGLAVFVAAVAAGIVGKHLAPDTSRIIRDSMADLAVGLGFSAALLCAKRGRWALKGLNPWLASFSYTTYLVHAPAMILMVATIHQVFGFGVGEQPTFRAFMFMAALIAVIYFYAWTFAFFTERRTSNARTWIGQIIRTRTHAS